MVLYLAYKVTTDKLQRVLLTSTHKFDWGLLRLLHTELHWLDIPEYVCIVEFNVPLDTVFGDGRP